VSEYTIEIAPTGYRSLRVVKDKETRREIAKVIDGLARSPVQGKPLLTPFEGLWSVRAFRSRYRILYSVDSDDKVVCVLFVGERKPGQEDDVYALARKLLRTLLGEEELS
jgi:mRNA-degrading endonuclease RelE of RelBE toxin-antitoxin system